MYEIRPESIKSFIEDNDIKLPRFQRKQTWDDKKNFQLCISIFKEYPIGVSILNVEDNGGIKTRWLLDGRQRRNALTKFYNDPENIYLWAKRFISIKDNDQLQDIDDKFWKKIDEYLEEDEIDEDEQTQNDDNFGETDEENTKDEESHYDNSKNGLELLLHIIKLTHTKSSKFSGFTRPFDFSKEIPKLPYLVADSFGKQILNSQKLKTFINEYKSYCSNEALDNKNLESFKEFMSYRFTYDDSIRKKVEIKITQNWSNICQRINILDKITNLYNNSKIGLIEVKNLKSVDSQKIFNIINSEGTKLSAVEILSAKPSWNIKIDSSNAKLSNSVKELYSKINVINNDIVKWDLPATLLSRLDYNSFFFKSFNESSKSDLAKSITLGFKILAGIYRDGVTKDKIDELGKDKNIKWEYEYEEIIHDLNIVSKLVFSFDYFKYLKSWKFSIMNNLSDAIALNFILLVYKDWLRKGKPIGNDTRVKQLQKNAFIILDASIYDYVTKKWRGSSDSKIAKNLIDFNKNPDVLTPVSAEKWGTLLAEVLEQDTIDGNDISLSLMQPMLYHFYAISNILGPDTNHSIEVDHIIPQSLFKGSSTIKNKEVVVHNIFNLGLLPKNENISKSNKTLTEVTNNWLIDQIQKYEFITIDEFRKYSDLNNLNDLREFRGEIIKDAYIVKRSSILNN